MRFRKLILGVLLAGVITAGLAVAVLPASAEKRQITITLLGGRQVVVTVDVPPGTPLDAIQLPSFSVPIVGVTDSGPLPEPTTTPATTPTPPPSTAPSTTP